MIDSSEKGYENYSSGQLKQKIERLMKREGRSEAVDILYEAAEHGKTDIMRAVLATGIDAGSNRGLVGRSDEESCFNAIHKAAEAGETEAVRILVESGEDVDRVGIGGDTPIHLAVREGHTGVVKELINQECDVDKNNKGPFEGVSPLHIAAKKGDTESVDLLLESGAEPDITPREDNPAPELLGEINSKTPLHVATMKGNKEVVKLLVNAGADVNKSMSRGTPLDIAKDIGEEEIADLLSDLE